MCLACSQYSCNYSIPGKKYTQALAALRVEAAIFFPKSASCE